MIRAQLEKAGWRGFYSLLEWYSARKGARFSVMNWGYHDGTDRVPATEPERYPLQLYQVLVEGLPLEGRVLVDASAGRGGGLHHLAKTFRPARAVGLDFTPRHVRLARARFGDSPELVFVPGDAERLPLPDGEADCVISVEASHCYAEPRNFISEAHRVLRPGGHLCWTDFAPPERADVLLAGARDQGFEVALERDITREVLAAMRLDRARRLALIDGNVPAPLRRLMLNFAAADDGVDTVRRFTEGRARYFLWRLRKR